MGDASNVVTLRTWADARDAFRHRELRQGLNDAGRALMEHVIVNLRDSDHTARRRLENRLFRRDTFVHYERDVLLTLLSNQDRLALSYDVVPREVA